LVNHDETEFMELDSFLNERVSANNKINFACGDGFDSFSLSSAGDRAGEQFQSVARGPKHVSYAPGMLLGQNFGWHHDGGLIAVFYCNHRGLDGDDGLSRSDIALKQAVHGAGAAHIGHDLAQRALLRIGWLEGQNLANSFSDAVVQLNNGAFRRLLASLPSDGHSQRQPEEFLEYQPSVGGGSESIVEIEGVVLGWE